MTVVPLKHDDDFFKHNQKAAETAAEEIRAFVADIESAEAQISDMNQERKDIYTIAKSKGYNIKALRGLIAERKRDAAALAEEREAVDVYRQLLL